MMDTSRSITSSVSWAGLRRRRLPGGLILENNKNNNKEETESVLLSSLFVRTLQEVPDSPSPSDAPSLSYNSEVLQDDHPCDESKCLSTGLISGGMFNCYGQGPGTLFPFICADQYVGVAVPSVDIATREDPNLKYYTCCPKRDMTRDNKLPPSFPHVEPQRHCQNPQLMEGTTTSDTSSAVLSAVCAASNSTSAYVYGRAMTYFAGVPECFMCCDTNIYPDDTSNNRENELGAVFEPETDDNASSNGLLLGDPIPDANDQLGVNGVVSVDPIVCYENWCQSQNCTVTNSFFNLQKMNCYSDVFQYPELLDINGNTGTYQCCSSDYHGASRYLSSSNDTNSTTTPPVHVQGTMHTNGSFLMNTTAFNATVWTQFIIAFIAFLISSTLIVAISLSLYKMKKKKSQQTTRGGHHGRRTTGPDYSSYNLYLVFLCIPDFIYNLFTMVVVMKHDYKGWIPSTDALITVCAAVNMYMNCIIAREVMVLLRRTKLCQRYSPPSYKIAAIQFGIVSLCAITLGLGWYFLLHNDTDTSSSSRDAFSVPWAPYTIPSFYILVVGLPLVYIVYVCFIIWHQELFPKDQVTGVVRRSRTSTTTNRTAGGTTASSSGASRRRLTLSLTRSNRTLQRLGGIFSRSRTSTGTSNNNEHNDTGDGGQHIPIHGSTTNTSGTATSSATTNTALPLTPQPTTMSTTTTTATTNTSTVVGGRLNILVMYFMRIILVFFFVWLPGMIMYYQAYVLERTCAGLLQNVGFFFFSLQAIVSGTMAMSKPDVRKAVHDLYDDTVRIVFGGLIRYIKENQRQRQEPKEEDQQEQAPTQQQIRSSPTTLISSKTNSTSIDTGNDPINNNIDTDNDNNSNNLKEDITLPRMIEEKQDDDNDVEAPLITSPSQSDTVLVQHDVSTTTTTNPTITGTVEKQPIDNTNIDDEKEKTKKQKKKKKKKTIKKNHDKDKNVQNSSDDDDDDAVHIVDGINNTAVEETKPPATSSKKKKKKKKKKDKKTNNEVVDDRHVSSTKN